MTTHFWNPPHLMPLVEVVMGQRTSLDLAEQVRDLLRRCGRDTLLPPQRGKSVRGGVPVTDEAGVELLAHGPVSAR